MKIETTDISRTASAATIVFEALRKAIIEGELKDGEPLRQDELAKMFSTSRIPVREAITRLEQEGLVQSVRFKGAVVASLSANEAAEIFDFRILLESTVIRQAVPKMTKDTLDEARHYCEQFYVSKDPMEWGTLNREFHYTLYKDSGLNYHLHIINNTLDRIDRYLRAQLSVSDGMMHKANDEHQAILNACEKGNAKQAADLTKKHILGVKSVLLDYLKNR